MRQGVVGLDIGTGGARAVLLTDAGDVAATFEATYPLSFPGPGFAEQDPEDWWQAAQEVLARTGVAARQAGVEIRAIGLTGQMHGAVFVGADDRPLRPAIIWMDQRTAAEAAELQERLAAAGLLEVVCNPALPNFTATKILWVMRREPDVWARTKYVLLPKDYIRYRLTGAAATDVSDASGTLLLDVQARGWSAEVAAQVGVRLEQLPLVYEGPEPTGELRPDVADAIHMAASVRVVAGGGDQPAAAVSVGVEAPGTAALSMGTSGVVLAPVAAAAGPLPHGLHAFCHAVPGMWFLMGVTQAAGGSFRWFRETLGGGHSYDDLTAAAASAPAGSEGLLFTPYLAGERCPHTDSEAVGAWIGLTTRHTLAHLTRSVLEGVSYSLKDALAAVQLYVEPARRITATGGGARSPLWRGVTEAILGVPIRWLEEQGPAVGAAVLAGRHAFAGDFRVIPAVVSEGEGFPADWAAVYAREYARFRRVYGATRAVIAQE